MRPIPVRVLLREISKVRAPGRAARIVELRMDAAWSDVVCHGDEGSPRRGAPPHRHRGNVTSMRDMVNGFAGFGASGVRVMAVTTGVVRNRPPLRVREHFVSRIRDALCCGFGEGGRRSGADHASRRRP
jgi:hypothetical protein